MVSAPHIQRLTNGESPRLDPRAPFSLPSLEIANASIFKHGTQVLLLTATQTERDAVLERLTPLADHEQVLRVFSGAQTYYLGRLGSVDVVLTTCRAGSQLRDGATLVTYEAIGLVRPRAVVAVGMAFGGYTDKLKIGDVLVSTHLIPYEPSRVQASGDIPRGGEHDAGALLLNRFLEARNWTFPRSDGLACQIFEGRILSGEKLVDSLQFKAELFSAHKEAIGGEMEGSGVYAAAERWGISEWLIVKSVCDWADGTKHKQHQPFAATVAAALVEHVFTPKGVLDDLSPFKRLDRGSHSHGGASATYGHESRTLPPQARQLGAFNLAQELQQQVLAPDHPFELILRHMGEGLIEPPAIPLMTISGEDVQVALSRESLLHRATLLLGSGGAGKSTMIRRLVASNTRAKLPSLLLRANAFFGNFETWMQSSLPMGVTIDAIETDAADRRQSWFLIVDGLNECMESQRALLFTTLSTILVRCRKVRLVCTSREWSAANEQLQFGSVLELGPLDEDTRAAILRLHDPEIDDTHMDEARALSTPLDLAHAAAVWRTVGSARQTRFALRDMFVNRKLQHDMHGRLHKLLRAFANELFKSASLAMPGELFVRWMEHSGNPSYREDLALLSSAMLLDEARGVVSFAHESLLEYFMVAWLLRQTSSLDELAVELGKPRYQDLSVLALEAQPDAASAAHLFVKAPTAQRSMLPLVQGKHGSLLREVAEDTLLEVLRGITTDLEWVHEGENLIARQSVNAVEAASLACAAELAMRNELYFRRVIAALKNVETHITNLTPVVAAKLRKSERAVRSLLYANTFWVVANTKASIIVRYASPGARHQLRCDPIVWEWALADELSPAGAMFAAEALAFVTLPTFDERHGAFLHHLVDVAWSVGWQHLRHAVLQLLFSCGRSLPAPIRESLRFRLSELPDQGLLVNSSLYEALEALGEEMHVDGALEISTELKDLLDGFRLPEMRSRAYGIFSQQFETLEALSCPASEAIEQLDLASKFRFYAMAALGASESSFHVDSCIDALGVCGSAPTHEDRDLLHEALGKWAEPPGGEFGKMPFDPSDRAASFLCAHERLARCGHPKPVTDTSPRGRVWAALACVVSGHVTGNPVLVLRSWNDLQGELLVHAWEPLGWIVMALRSGMHRTTPNLLALWPVEMASLLTKLVLRRSEWIVEAPFQKHLVELALERFVAALADVGGQVARAVLLDLIDQAGIGEIARTAIRRIDERR